jgi:hypothetical protein
VSGATGAAEDDPTRHLLDLHQEQLSIEEAGMKAAVEEAFEMDIKQAAQMRGGTATGLSQKLLKAWTIPLANAIAEEQDLCIKLVSGLDRNAYGPLLLLARPQELAGFGAAPLDPAPLLAAPRAAGDVSESPSPLLPASARICASSRSHCRGRKTRDTKPTASCGRCCNLFSHPRFKRRKYLINSIVLCDHLRFQRYPDLPCILKSDCLSTTWLREPETICGADESKPQECSYSPANRHAR